MFRHVQGDKVVVLRAELPAVAAAAGRRLPWQPVQPVRGLALCTARIDAAAACWVQQVICSAAFAYRCLSLPLPVVQRPLFLPSAWERQLSNGHAAPNHWQRLR